MKSTPLVSIIIPVYNRDYIISETLKSIQEQSFKDWECIIVDDGSKDSTEKVIEPFILSDKRFSFYKRPDNISKGACGCRNYGLELAKAEYVNWFDSDDLMQEDCLEIKYNKITEEDYDFVSCEFMSFIDEGNKRSYRKMLNVYDGNTLVNYFCGKVSFYTPGPLWKKTFLLENELKFPEDSKVLNDWVFNLNALFLTENYFLIRHPLIDYRDHPASISGNLANFRNDIVISELKIRREYYAKFLQKKLVTKEVSDYYLYRISSLLEGVLLRKDKHNYGLFKELMGFSLKKHFYVKFKCKLFIGYLSSILLNKGHRLVKYRINLHKKYG